MGGRGASAGRNAKGTGVFEGSQYRKVSLPNGNVNVFKGSKRVGLISGSRTYIYEGSYGGISTGDKVDAGNQMGTEWI